MALLLSQKVGKWYYCNIMKTLLIFPAQWYPTQPYLSTPYLTAFLQDKGWQISQRDFNIETYDSFLSSPLLRQAEEMMRQRQQSLKEQSSLSIKEKSHLDVLSMGLKFSDKIIDGVEEAKSVMRTPERFFDFNAYQQADMVIKSALKLVSDAYAPSIFSLSTFESGTRAEESTQKAHETTRDTATNPFINL